MLFPLYIGNVICSAGQTTFGKLYTKQNGSSLVFNLNKTLIGIVLFLVVGLLGGFSFHIPTLVFGIIYGTGLCISMHAGFKAIATGPMALSSIIASFSLIIPFLFGVIFLDEAFGLYKLAGIMVLLFSIFMINAKREKGFSVKWLFYALATMLANGICSVILKLHQMRFPTLYRTEFMFWALICVFAILFLTAIPNRDKIQFNISFCGIASGALNCGANYIVLYLSATENASVLFPIVSVANIMTVWLIGLIFFKERLKLCQSIGLLLGIISIVLLKL